MALYSEELCDYCKDLNFDLLNYHQNGWEGLDFNGQERDISDVLETASHCTLCKHSAQLYNRVKEPFDQQVNPYRSKKGGLRTKLAGVSSSTEGHTLGQLMRLKLILPIQKNNGNWLKPSLIFQRCGQIIASVDDFCRAPSLVEWHVGGALPYEGRMRPLVANTRLFRKWRETCLTRHHAHCSTSLAGARPTVLRLVDVVDRCIVDAKLEDKYVALSYVWGGIEMPTLTRATKPLLYQPGSLDAALLPSTIEDAITTTAALNERYLWVDSLCILQDDDVDKLLFIPYMSSIYGAAEITIIAASGDNANAGLPGVRPSTRSRQQTVFNMKGVPVMVSLEDSVPSPESASLENESSSGNHISNAACNRRGWCYQERLMSVRALIFGPEQVYWECAKATWCEEAFWESPDHPELYRHSATTVGFSIVTKADPQPFEYLYRELAQRYSQLHFTFQSDKFNAFRGILKLLERACNQKFFWAMPLTYFGDALAWKGTDNLQRNTSKQSQAGANGKIVAVPFPSWAWVGWIGENEIHLRDSWDGQEQLIIFYRLNEEGSNLEILNQSKPPAEDLRCAVEEPAETLFPSSFDRSNTVVTIEQLPSHVLSSPLAALIICFWSSTASLNLCREASSVAGRADPVRLTQAGREVTRTYFSSWPTMQPGESKSYEFVVVKRGKEDMQFHVLLIEWENGVAYRQGVAIIAERYWEELETEWKLIILG